MNTGIPLLDNIYDIFFLAVVFVLVVLLLLCLLRAIIGPKVADRLVAVNMTGTLVMVIVAVLALKMEQAYLVDICLIYAMISFLAVIILSKVYLGVYQEHKAREKEES